MPTPACSSDRGTTTGEEASEVVINRTKRSIHRRQTRTAYDADRGRTHLSDTRRMAIRMTYALLHRHWVVGVFFVLVPVVVLAPHFKSLDTDEEVERGDVNEPVGAVIGMLGSVYALATVFAFQGSRDRIMQITDAIHSELSALQKMQLLAQSGIIDAHLADTILSSVVNYVHLIAIELKVDAWTFGNTLYSTHGNRCEETQARDRKLFGAEPLMDFTLLVAVISGGEAAAEGGAQSERCAGEFRALIGLLIDGRNRRLAQCMYRMPLIEWCLLEIGSYAFMCMMALLDTGSVLRDRLLISVTGFVLIALNHLVADANEPLVGSFKVKKTLVKHFIIAAEEAAALGAERAARGATLETENSCSTASITFCARGAAAVEKRAGEAAPLVPQSGAAQCAPAAGDGSTLLRVDVPTTPGSASIVGSDRPLTAMSSDL